MGFDRVFRRTKLAVQISFIDVIKIFSAGGNFRFNNKTVKTRVYGTRFLTGLHTVFSSLLFEQPIYLTSID